MLHKTVAVHARQFRERDDQSLTRPDGGRRRASTPNTHGTRTQPLRRPAAHGKDVSAATWKYPTPPFGLSSGHGDRQVLRPDPRAATLCDVLELRSSATASISPGGNSGNMTRCCPEDVVVQT